MNMNGILSRRTATTRTSALLVGAAAAATLVACSPMSGTTASVTSSVAGTAPFNASDFPPSSPGRSSTKGVEFANGDIAMAGNVFVPADFDATRTYPTIVVVHPGGGVKEQTAGVYAQRLADQGFVTLAFDASYQGQSGGLPRYLDNPMNRVGDIYSAVDYLTTLTYVDDANIGILGICAGGGVTIKASTTDPRISAVATVSGVDTGAVNARGWNGDANIPAAEQLANLKAAAAQRTAEAAGAEPVYGRYVPEIGDTTAPLDLQEAADYYLTPRGQYPTAPNKMLVSGQVSAAGFNGFDRIETLLTQPLLVVAGSDAGSRWHSEELYQRAASTQKQLDTIDGATHMDLYDGPARTRPCSAWSHSSRPPSDLVLNPEAAQCLWKGRRDIGDRTRAERAVTRPRHTSISELWIMPTEQKGA